MIAPCRLYLTVDGEVVFGDDERAAFLLCGQGAEIPAGFSLPAPAEPAPEKVEASAVPKPEPKPAKKKPQS